MVNRDEIWSLDDRPISVEIIFNDRDNIGLDRRRVGFTRINIEIVTRRIWAYCFKYEVSKKRPWSVGDL